MHQGYIKLHRKLFNNPIMSEPKYLLLWVTLLLMANHKETSIIFNNKRVIIPVGSFITGRKELVKRTKLNRNFIERALKYFESEAQIEQRANTKFRMISVTNWAAYQANEQPASSQRAASEQPASTNKNDKNEKNDKNNSCEEILTKSKLDRLKRGIAYE
jgi:hypothetical protein